MQTVRTLLLYTALVFASGAASAQDKAPEPQPRGAEQAKVLVDLLKDDAARAALIEQLEKAAADSGEPRPDAGLVNVLARRTAVAAEKFAGFAHAAVASMTQVKALFSGESGQFVDGTLSILRDLAVLVVVTMVLFHLLRMIAVRMYVRLARRASEAGWLRVLTLLLVSSLIDVVTAVGAWATGYGVALALGEPGEMDVSQTLFLNAFLIVELVKVSLRAVLVPRYAELRMLALSDESAAYWCFWASRQVSLLGYGLLLVVPLVRDRISATSANALAVVVCLTALVIVVVIVVQNRATVRARLETRAAHSGGRLESTLLRLLARTWHLAAIVYFVALFVVWSAAPQEGAGWMLAASLQSAAAIVLGLAVNGFIARWVAGGIRVTDDVRERLPLLEQRLNAYVPLILRVVRLGISACVVLALVHVWGAIDVMGWLQQEAGRETMLRIVSAFLVVVAALAVYLGVSSWVEFRLNPNVGTLPTARERTLLALFRNAFTIALVVLTGMLVLAQLGMDIGPLLAGAGVLGLAIGFGAQKLVQDVITGAFIQFENAMNEGDVVTVGGITGKVERLTIRSVGLRDLHGVYHVIPFSSADSVSNFMKGFSYHVAEVGVAYRENVAEVKALMHEAFDRLKNTEQGDQLIDVLEMHGVTQFADSAVLVRARLKCMPGAQWGLGRAYNEILKEVFDEHGVEIPFPHVTLYMGEDKRGNAPALNVRGELATAPESP